MMHIIYIGYYFLLQHISITSETRSRDATKNYYLEGKAANHPEDWNSGRRAKLQRDKIQVEQVEVSL